MYLTEATTRRLISNMVYFIFFLHFQRHINIHSTLRRKCLFEEHGTSSVIKMILCKFFFMCYYCVYFLYILNKFKKRIRVIYPHWQKMLKRISKLVYFLIEVHFAYHVACENLYVIYKDTPSNSSIFMIIDGNCLS